ncbi:short chain dehydrogenase/reductase family protein [Talaromyces stipitatus ATCC 10500]|uniref:Short chain dehydrogenase/reductase family protein n=1 Tax=Talaromyces stipitatus (strain ATCC 10500 / CBS 375.48 / QM 6759 / NRRL 1006) TaxID=441959 RepID=B8MAQ3_TALSN|nr:short chain dehydrogenase/reductase family protein [Talaromyces stipitatus ATCC 10500]EED17743.1 short chain dehydrogenase/reductase family protein [Talaromyces stipitatus ATCC 10500]
MQSALHSIIGPKKVTPDNLNGRVAVVLGGALGIGYEVARAFALAGARVIMVNRKSEQGDEAIAAIKKESEDKAKIDWVGCDMGDLKQIRDVFTNMREKEERLDLLVLSAGINANQYRETNDKIDSHFQINWLGQFYVVNQLYPLLRKTSRLPDTPAPRIVWESSELHRMAPSDVKFSSKEEINNPDIGSAALYARTKLAIILGVDYGLVQKVIKPNHDHIYALSVHPGAVNTTMQQQWKEAYPGLLGKLLTATMQAISRDPEQGAYSALYAAVSPEVEEKGWNGHYFTDPGQLGQRSKQASGPALGDSLWELSEKMIQDVVGEDALVDWNS